MRRAVLFVLVGVLPLAPFACNRADPAAAQQTGGRKGGKGAVYSVDVMAVESKKVDYIVTAPGTIDAFEHVQITARVAGVVDKVNFAEGQEVKKGDSLVIIDSQRFQLSLNSAQAALQKAQAAQKDTEAQVARREGASEGHPGLIPGEELETYKTKSLTAKADTAVANENVKVAALNMSDSAVRSPMEGTVQTRTVETGQYVNAGYVMATILRADPLLLHFSVEPADAPRLKPGMVATFTLRESQNTYDAKITLVSGAADSAVHTVQVTAQVDVGDKKYWLRPGSFADVAVDVNATRDAPVIPRSATRATDHGYIVYTIEGDSAVEKVVTLGMNTKDGWVEVRSGLKGGELLVVRGVESMTNGALVKALKVDSLDAAAPEIPLMLDGGGRMHDGGGFDGGAAHRKPK